MPTRLYVTNAGPTYAPPTVKGFWDAGFPTTIPVFLLAKNKQGGAIGNNIRSPTSSGPNLDIVMHRAISERLAAQTIPGGACNLLMGSSPIPPGISPVWEVYAYITQGDTDNVRGVIVDFIDSLAWASNSANGLSGVKAANSVVVSAGDRLVIEIGYRIPSFGAGNTPCTIYYGAPEGAIDLVPGGNISNDAGWFDFSQDIAFIPDPSYVEHAVIQVTNRAPAVSSEVQHSVIQVAQAASTVPTIAEVQHAIIQVVVPPPPALPDLSGLYFMNQDKVTWHDSYYNSTELKIQDPTIKTAFMGE